MEPGRFRTRNRDARRSAIRRPFGPLTGQTIGCRSGPARHGAGLIAMQIRRYLDPVNQVQDHGDFWTIPRRICGARIDAVAPQGTLLAIPVCSRRCHGDEPVGSASHTRQRQSRMSPNGRRASASTQVHGGLRLAWQFQGRPWLFAIFPANSGSKSSAPVVPAEEAVSYFLPKLLPRTVSGNLPIGDGHLHPKNGFSRHFPTIAQSSDRLSDAHRKAGNQPFRIDRRTQTDRLNWRAFACTPYAPFGAGFWLLAKL